MDLPADFQRPNLTDNAQDELDHLSVLPTEVMEIIFSFVRPKSLYQNVLPVCRRFRLILSTENWWLRRIRNHHFKVRLCDTELQNDDFSPIRTYDAMLREEKIRKNWNERKRFQLVNPLQRIESVKLFERTGEKFCISSARSTVDFENYTQCIQLWNLDVAVAWDDASEGNRAPLVHQEAFPTQDRIGVLEMCGKKRFISKAIHGSLKLWEIGEAGFREISKKESNLAKNSLSIDERTLACYTGYKTIQLLDVDNGLQEIGRTTELPTTREDSYIKSVKLKGTTVYALFTDQLMTLDARNLRAGPVHQQVFEDLETKFLFDGRQIPHRHWYTSMSVADGLIHCCHSGGEISVLQAADLTPCYSFYASDDYCERLSLNYVAKTRGSVLALTTESVTAFSLGSQPECIGKANYRGSGEPVLDVLHEDIVVGSLGGLIYWPTDNS